MRKVSRTWSCLLSLLLFSGSPRLLAQRGVEPLEEAKTLFREGVALLNAGDPERALELFLKSRAIVPSGKNTANAAICLERLGRYDEALELYEELLARFAADLDAQDRERLAPIMASLRNRLGRLDISASVDAALVVDSKPRGNLPRTTPLRLLPGQHRIRVVREGYWTFERRVEVEAGQTVEIDAELEPLAGLGALRVEEVGGEAGHVLIDGKAVGVTPWEGTAAAGLHVLQVVAGDRGSVPQAIEVIDRRTMILRVGSRPLGQPLRISVSPAHANLFLEKTRLGSAEWIGRLPLGEYEVRATAPGHLPVRQTLKSAAGPGTAMHITLRRDPAVVQRPFPWHLAAGGGLGLLAARTLNGGDEQDCPSRCDGSRLVLGGKVEALVDIAHSVGLGVRLAAGYAFAHQDFERSFSEPRAGYTISYRLAQEIVLGGPYGRAAFIAEAPLPWKVAVRGEAGLGFLVWSYEAFATGWAWTNDGADGAVPAATSGLERISEVAPFVTAALELERSVGRLGIWVGLGSWFVPGSGPTFSQAQIVDGAPCTAMSAPDAVECARTSSKPASERVRGPLLLFTPALGVRYRF